VLAERAGPTLDDLRTIPEAAWLWDPARARIVWANPPGIAFFGGDSLFDLLDRPFGLMEPGVERILVLSRGLSRGETETAHLSFPSAGAIAPVACRCSIHALPDGRLGLLTVARPAVEQAVSKTADAASAFDHLPFAAALTGRDGTFRQVNATALALLGAGQRTSLRALLGESALAEELLDRTEAAGTTALTRRLAVKLGPRDIRLTFKALQQQTVDAAFALVMMEDVTERRALERQLNTSPSPVPAPAIPTVAEKPKEEAPPPAPPRIAGSDAAVFEKLGKSVEDGIRHFAPPEVQAPPPAELRLVPSSAIEPEPEPPTAPQPEPEEPPPAPRTSAEVIQLPLRHAASEADQELRAILDTAADGIITLDPEARIHTFSAGAEAIFGYRIADVAGKPFVDLLAPESRKTVRDYLAALQGPGLASVFNDGREVTALARQGGPVPLFLTIGKLEAPRSQAAFCAVVRDITQWKKTEAELRDAKERAEATSRQKSEFLASVSHELRTPLNAIMGFSEVMRLGRFGEIDNEKYRGYVQDIHASGAHLLSLIDDLLDLSKVEAGRLELNFTSVNLGDVAEHAMKLLTEQATAARVVLRKSFPADLPNVVADLRSMRQIMLNLLSNAIKFTDPGGQVVVSASLAVSGELKLRVKDSGIGMDEDQLKNALEPFRRVATEGRDVKGTGLGLPLTKALVEANRASFRLSSEPRRGTLAEITFPTPRVLAE